MTWDEFDEASGGNWRGTCVVKHKKSGKEYFLSFDQVDTCKPDGGRGDGVVYGFPCKPHPRQRGCKWKWLNIANVDLVKTKQKGN